MKTPMIAQKEDDVINFSNMDIPWKANDD